MDAEVRDHIVTTSEELLVLTENAKGNVEQVHRAFEKLHVSEAKGRDVPLVAPVGARSTSLGPAVRCADTPQAQGSGRAVPRTGKSGPLEAHV